MPELISANQQDEAETSEQKEQRRLAIEKRLNEATSTYDPRLSKVLSYFPEIAEKVIATQTRARSISGKEGFHLILRHSGGRLEHLDVTGNDVIKTLAEIDRLRGAGTLATESYYFGEGTEIILYALNDDSGNFELIKKTLEVMGVTNAEIELLRKGSETRRKAIKLEQKAEILRREAAQLQEDANNLREEYSESVHQLHPRRVQVD
jgi:hypothetical protein